MHTNVLNLSKKLINISSISPRDLGCQEILIKRLQLLGFFIERINLKDTKNFWAYRGKGKTVTFLGHTDVVPAGSTRKWKTSPFVATIKDGKLFGRGSADMKGSIAAMLIAVENFIKKFPNHKGRISFLITSDEETSGKNGIRKVVSILKEKKEVIDFCLVGEPTSEKILGDCVKNGRRGSLSADLMIYGTQGHIAYPKLFLNPIHNSIPFLLDLSNLIFDKGNLFFEPTSIQISKIFSEKNCTLNMIPGELRVFFNIRFNTLVNKKKIIRIVENLLNKYLIKYSIFWTYHAKPFLSSSNFLLNLLTKCIYKHTNIIPKIKNNGGTSDARFIFNLTDKIIEFGLPNLTIHKVNEYVYINDLLKLQNIYYSFLEKLLL
ncbi:succinyl-diaminopimelate desuccinylase [Buchnera aphidicola]|uniref:Succinyl-diaminopimelate desuccinylase n=1 Tax=Buchnera aphidicola subsp. Cinara cedri (strain Cc) TaxID=372461 RepID=DAPE_BUCCC|nr:succinyl-diaminopimelate desuccinylase [Buchnera aphidicola]Q058B2.1 RecName: Full=Succinyl-diaminopimelate desuccinylase; Short=SDAP desuccinylase; AltName: Full=N-succinyl-LL-2,6-diaminoheptanedioate amidohydrolase [Buchnera aphidicola BCc]ABJ90537.1 succinyl-diaminopimelate desuccinylase [Buchnera aphidicola BCc]